MENLYEGTSLSKRVIRVLIPMLMAFVMITVNPTNGQVYSNTPYCQFCDENHTCHTNGRCCLTRKEDFKKNYRMIER